MIKLGMDIHIGIETSTQGIKIEKYYSKKDDPKISKYQRGLVQSFTDVKCSKIIDVNE